MQRVRYSKVISRFNCKGESTRVIIEFIINEGNASGCFAVLRRIKSIRRSVSLTVLQSLMVALVLPRLHYGSTLLAGLPKQLLDRLQFVQNAAARLVFAARRNDHITPLLHSLHWLRVAERITFRLTYRCLHGSAPEYLTSLLQCVSDTHTRQRLRSASSSDLMVPRTILSIIGERSFQSAAAFTWNALSRSVRSSTSLLQFRSRLKTELFARSYQQSY